MPINLATIRISIHAPARGATVRRFCATSMTEISIHAPARGATRSCSCKQTAFQISIHAPARGATKSPYSFSGSMTNFNPRSREGSDWNRPRNSLKSLRFQSTLPRGERRDGYQTSLVDHIFQSTLPRGERQPQGRVQDCKYPNFNPRSREGSDFNFI